MAWIKMNTDLGTHPKVVRISSGLCADRLRVIGGLHAVWSLFDKHSQDGSVRGYTLEAIDDIIGWPGFSAAMVEAEWLDVSDDSLCIPRFDEHNGASAKRRAEDQVRKKESRSCPKNVGDVSAKNADTMRTREDKSNRRTKDINTTVPDGGGGAPNNTVAAADWTPPITVYTDLRMVHGIEPGFADDVLLEFKTYRAAERRTSADWNAKFLQRVVDQWDFKYPGMRVVP